MLFLSTPIQLAIRVTLLDPIFKNFQKLRTYKTEEYHNRQRTNASKKNMQAVFGSPLQKIKAKSSARQFMSQLSANHSQREQNQLVKTKIVTHLFLSCKKYLDVIREGLVPEPEIYHVHLSHQ